MTKAKPEPVTAPPDTNRRLIGIPPDVLRLTGWSASTLERRLVAGEFPNPVENGHRVNRK